MLATHTKPFQEIENGGEVALKYSKGERPPIPINIPPKYLEIMRRAWSQEPENRPEMRLICKELYELYQPPPSSSSSSTESILPGPSKALRRSAELGDADAQYSLFEINLHRARQQNKKPYIAKAYLEMAVDQKHEKALYAYGKHCLDKTLDIDFAKGFSAIMQLDALGNKNAMTLLNSIIKNGDKPEFFEDKHCMDASNLVSLNATISP